MARTRKHWRILSICDDIADKGMTRKEAADEFGLHPSTIDRYITWLKNIDGNLYSKINSKEYLVYRRVLNGYSLEESLRIHRISLESFNKYLKGLKSENSKAWIHVTYKLYRAQNPN